FTHLGGLSLRLSPLRHTERGVLAEPFNNSKKSGWGQRIDPCPPGKYLLLVDRSQLPGVAVESKLGGALVAQLVAGVVGHVLQWAGDAIQVHAFGELDTLAASRFVLDL